MAQAFVDRLMTLQVRAKLKFPANTVTKSLYREKFPYLIGDYTERDGK
jgi:hypothetical protein